MTINVLCAVTAVVAVTCGIVAVIERWMDND